MCYDVTCRYSAGAGNTGLSCAASCCCSDEPDIVEPAPWHLNLLHIRLARDGNDGLKLGATDSAHRDGLHWFNILKMFGCEREAIKSKRQRKAPNSGQNSEFHTVIWLFSRHCFPILPVSLFGWWPLWPEIPAWAAVPPGAAGQAPRWQAALQISEKHWKSGKPQIPQWPA